jgi:hypothetical protein
MAARLKPSILITDTSCGTRSPLLQGAYGSRSHKITAN